jgi:hypothetical protein
MDYKVDVDLSYFRDFVEVLHSVLCTRGVNLLQGEQSEVLPTLHDDT